MASKLEDIKPITLDELYNEAGHKYFSKLQIVYTEQKILKTLKFRLLDSMSQSLYSEAYDLFF
jgi:Cyclin, N-terminal domain